MSAFDIIQRWLQPLLDPLNEVRTVIQQPQSIHQEAVTTFTNLVGSLYEGPDQFEGDAATSMQVTTQAYLHAEAQFSGVSILAGGASASAGALLMASGPAIAVPTETVLENVAKVSVECATEITGAATTAAGEMAADAGLDTVTEVVDVAAVAQAGLDPVTDIPAAVLTAIDLGTKIAILVALGWSIFQAVQSWMGEMNRLGHVTWPPLPSFLDLYGSSAGFANQGKLTLPQMKIAEELFEEFKSTGITQDEINQIIDNNPGLSKEQYRLLVEYYQRYRKIPYGVVSIIGVGTNKKGKAAKIFYVTKGDIAHIRDGHDEFKTLTNVELIATIEGLLQQNPDEIDRSRKDSDTYYYDDVEIDGKYYEVQIAISNVNPGRIVTYYMTYGQG